MAIVNNALVNIVVDLSLQIIVFLFSFKSTHKLIVGSCGSSVLILWGTSTFSVTAAPVYSPTMREASCFLYIIVNIVICCILLSFWHVLEDIPLYFCFLFYWWLVMLSIFSCASCPSACLLCKNVYSDPLPILGTNPFSSKLLAVIFSIQ